MNMKIKTIIFDIGNVLADFKWEEYYRKFGFSEAILERIAKATVGSSVWHAFDRGGMTDEEILQAFIENDPGIETELRAVFENIQGMVVKNEYAIPWIKELKEKGYQVLVLSNFSHKAHVDCMDALEFLQYVDGGILSYQDKVIKPMPEIYSLLLERYHLKGEECVFLDDLQRNLDGAGDFGIHTILFKNQTQAKEELKKLGVE